MRHWLSSLLVSFNVLVVVISMVSCQSSTIDFSVRLVSAGVDSVLFEILDDNVTATNYLIRYGLNAGAAQNSEALGAIENSMPIRMITNPFGLIKKDQEEKAALNNTDFDYDDADRFGEQFSYDKVTDIKAKSYAQMHRFSITDLDANTNYEISLTITAHIAHLQRKIITGGSTPATSENAELKTTVKKFVFKFKTLFDLASAASAACEEFHRSQASLEPSSELYETEDYFSSCYTDTSNCTECKSSCYQVAMNNSMMVRVPSGKPKAGGKPILCEPCPCDTTKSTGDCVVVNQSTVKCTQCIEPYTGLLCKECRNEGIEFYRNEQGECMVCNCNGNSAYDILGPSSNGKKTLKCQAGTGKHQQVDQTVP